MKFSIIATTAIILLSSPLASIVKAQAPDDDLCFGKTQAETEIDLFNSVVTESTLHQPGGRLVYENVGIVRDKPVNLVVKVYEGDYTTSVPNKNGKGNNAAGEVGKGMFGNINLQTQKNDIHSGEGNFEFCFHDKETDQKVVVDSFMWSVYDLDERNADNDGIKEKLIFDTKQAQDYVLLPDTEVKLFCENFQLWPYTSATQTNQLPCNEGERVIFHSSTKGVGDDNPKDKDHMTDQQKNRSVQFTFVNTDCWRFTYNHYCPPDEAGDSKGCQWYGGGNFLFAGSAKQLIEEGECITDSPTQSPTDVPTATPTKSPTTSPTASPTKSPTKSPTASPTAAPTKSPTQAPTKSPTQSPTASPTVAPTASPTAAPTEAPTKSPTSSPTASPTKGPTKNPTATPTASPTEDPTASPTMNPTVSPTSTPTASPTASPTTSPTASPSAGPTKNPTASPTASPTTSPTKTPTASPSAGPTKNPTASPTESPTASPTDLPTKTPTASPSAGPTKSPTTSPTVRPTASPTKSPTASPTVSPTKTPTDSPTASPTKVPTIAPTASPTASMMPTDCFEPAPPNVIDSVCMTTNGDLMEIIPLPKNAIEIWNQKGEDSLEYTISQKWKDEAGLAVQTGLDECVVKGNMTFGDSEDFIGECISGSTSVTIVVYLDDYFDPDECEACNVNDIDDMGGDYEFCAYRVEIPCDSVPVECGEPTTAPSASTSSTPSASHSETPTASPTKAPTNAPTESPSASPSGSFYPSSAPSDTPTKSMYPSSSPTDVPSNEPTNAPTKSPTASPTASPTKSPTASPTVAPTNEPTTLPTASPTASPTKGPTAEPTVSPTYKITQPPIDTNGEDDDDDFFFEGTCPEDVKLLAQNGKTDIDLDRVVKIVSQDTSTVRVALNQGWDQLGDEDIPIDRIFYSFRPDTFDEKCYEETSVVEGTVFDTITIQCHVTKPFATLEICVVDDLKNELLTIEDDASVPQCCHNEEPEKPTVCYTIKINCVTECVEDDDNDNARRGLRGSY